MAESQFKYRPLHRYKYQLVLGCKYTIPEDLFQSDNTAGLFGASIDIGMFARINWTMRTIVGKKGYCWDGPSGPTIDTPNFMRGSLFHDILYQLMRERVFYRRWRLDADEMLRRICLEDGMSKIRARWVYWGVATFGAKAAGG